MDACLQACYEEATFTTTCTDRVTPGASSSEARERQITPLPAPLPHVERGVPVCVQRDPRRRSSGASLTARLASHPPSCPPRRSGWSIVSESTGGFGNTTANIIIAVFLLLLSGLFSGLTLGLMSLDMVSLEILEEGRTMRSAVREQILPVRAKGNLLLCTLLLGNTLVNSLIAILMADLTDGRRLGAVHHLHRRLWRDRPPSRVQPPTAYTSARTRCGS